MPDQPNYEQFLVDAEERANRFPKTFSLPHETYRHDRRPGDVVKVILSHAQASPGKRNADGYGAERPWVRVESVGYVDEKRFYRCTFANDGFFFSFVYGDPITIEPKHIIEV